MTIKPSLQKIKLFHREKWYESDKTRVLCIPGSLVLTIGGSFMGPLLGGAFDVFIILG